MVQLDRRSGTVVDEDGVHDKFGVAPASIPDWLALVGDSADGFPGLRRAGARRSASVVLDHYGHLEAIPDDPDDWDPAAAGRPCAASPRLAGVLAAEREAAELFRVLATLRVDRSLLADVGALAWHGPTPEFAAVCEHLRDPGLPGADGAAWRELGRLRPDRARRRAPNGPSAGRRRRPRPSSSGTGVSSWA